MDKFSLFGTSFVSLICLTLPVLAHADCGNLRDVDVSVYQSVVSAAGNCNVSDELSWVALRCKDTAAEVNGFMGTMGDTVQSGTNLLNQGGAAAAQTIAQGSSASMSNIYDAARSLGQSASLKSVGNLSSMIDKRMGVLNAALAGHKNNIQLAMEQEHNLTMQQSNCQLGMANAANPSPPIAAEGQQQMMMASQGCAQIAGVPGGGPQCQSVCAKALQTVQAVQKEQQGMVTALQNAVAESNVKLTAAGVCQQMYTAQARANAGYSQQLNNSDTNAMMKGMQNADANPNVPGETQVAQYQTNDNFSSKGLSGFKIKGGDGSILTNYKDVKKALDIGHELVPFYGPSGK